MPDLNAHLTVIDQMNAYSLANLADCFSPDSLDSEGVAFLVSVRDDLTQRMRDGEMDDDALNGIADAAPSDYTHLRWEQFVDLGAYQEDCQNGDWPENPTAMAGAALYQIAYRLAESLMTCTETGDPITECAHPDPTDSEEDATP